MKKLLITLIILLAVGGVCVVTCPDRQAHKDAIMTLVNNKLNDEVNESGLGDLFNLLGSSFASNLFDKAIDSKLSVDNHFLFSVGKYQGTSEAKTVSFGILGHVFTPSQEQFDAYVDEQIKSLGVE